MDDIRYDALKLVYSRLAMEVVELRNEINRLVEDNNQLRSKIVQLEEERGVQTKVCDNYHMGYTHGG
jgi:cell division protein FtsB